MDNLDLNKLLYKKTILDPFDTRNSVLVYVCIDRYASVVPNIRLINTHEIPSVYVIIEQPIRLAPKSMSYGVKSTRVVVDKHNCNMYNVLPTEQGSCEFTLYTGCRLYMAISTDIIKVDNKLSGLLVDYKTTTW